MKLRNAFDGAWIAAAVAAIDRAGKVAAMQIPPGEVIPVIPGVLQLRCTVNTGMAFSLLSGQTLLLTALSALLLTALSAWLLIRPQGQPKMLRAALWMVVGGGLGNLWDRIFYGHVVDFIEPTFVRFAVFNPADVFICIGVGLAALAMILDERKKEPPHD